MKLADKSPRAHAPSSHLADTPLRVSDAGNNELSEGHRAELEVAHHHPVGPLVMPVVLGAGTVALSALIFFLANVEPSYNIHASPLMPAMTAFLLWFLALGGGALSSLKSLRMARWDQAHGDEHVADDGHALRLKLAGWSGLALALLSIAIVGSSWF